MLDSRLSLAAALYAPCDLGADIGTDHALLPCHLLRKNICRSMLLCDVSPKALRHAEASVRRYHLEARARLCLADGLDALDAAGQGCGCVSIMGMGGDTLSGILRRGAARLRGAVLVLSAHTEQPLVRQAIADIGYHLTAERLCLAAGRYYILWRAEPGEAATSPEAIRYGELLFEEPTPLLSGYLDHRLRVLEARRQGLLSGAGPADTAAVDADIAFYAERRRRIP